MKPIYFNPRQQQICEQLESWNTEHRFSQDLIAPYWRVEVPEWSNRTGDMCRYWHDVTKWTDEQLKIGFEPIPTQEESEMRTKYTKQQRENIEHYLDAMKHEIEQAAASDGKLSRGYMAEKMKRITETLTA